MGRGWQGGSWVCHLYLNLPAFCGALHFIPQLCPESGVLWVLDSNLICTLEQPAEILKVQPAPSHTNQNSDQKLWDRTYVKFWKAVHVIPVCSCGGESLLLWTLLSSGPSIHLRLHLRPHLPLYLHRVSCRTVRPQSMLPPQGLLPTPVYLEWSLSEYLHGSLLSDFCSVARTTSHTLSSCSISHIRSVTVLLAYFFPLEQKLQGRGQGLSFVSSEI